MKTKSIYQGIALLAVALTTAACQNELNEESSEPKPSEKISMTIRATQGMAPKTRTSYEDKLGVTNIDEIVVKWESEEKVKVFGYNSNELNYSVDFNSIQNSLSADGKSISFAGAIEAKDLYLAMYPVNNCKYEDEAILTSFLKQTQNCVTPMAHLKDFDFMVGEPENTGEYDKFIFTHQATMIRFILSLPSEVITKVSLSSTKKLYSGVFTTANGDGGTTQVDELLPVSSLDLIVINHTKSDEALKAYMMMPPFDASNDVLTITVSTSGGKTYEGKLTTGDDTMLEAGLCYTLTPTLELSNTIAVPPISEGNLGEELDKITPTTGQTELALTGAVNSTDLTALATFLKDEKAKSITTLDLSALTIANTGTDGNGAPIIAVTGFADCTSLTDVKLPVEATTIGDDAFNGCTSLKTVSQDEPTTDTRASISSRLKSVGARAFKGTAIDVMFLHKNITSVGNNAFEGCTALTALVFEGTNTVGNGITLGADILKNCTNGDLNILLPYITDVKVAAAYKKDLGKATYYEYNGMYSSANPGDKVISESYKASVPDGSSLTDFESGGNWGN